MIVLDTHALVWWVADPAQIPAKSRRLIERAAGQTGSLLVSCISVWEIAMLVARRRLELTVSVETWLGALQGLPFLTFVPIDNSIAVRAVMLPSFPHKDPADRFIVATVLETGATLVTADRRLRAYRPLATAWE
jgi:PIN domain nuclease of toxin-antitoxin system